MTDYLYTELHDPSATGLNTVPQGINNLGQVVGYYSGTPNGTDGFLYSGGNYTTIDDPLGVATSAQGINGSGQIVGAYRDASNVAHGFLYSGGNYTTLDDPSAAGTTAAFSINSSGQIVGYYNDVSGVAHGFLDTGGSYTTLDDPLGINGTFAEDINDNGQIVGVYYDASNARHGFLYSSGNYTTLDYPTTQAGNGTNARAINNTGQIVGRSNDDRPDGNGWLYSGGTYTTLNDPAAAANGSGTQANGINDSGEIVGYFYGNGYTHGFLATPVEGPDTGPEPPALTAPASLNVPAGGSTPMGITASPVDSDDALSVTISGVPLFEAIKAPSGDTVTYQLVKGTRGAGDSRTFTITAGTAGQAISGLTLNSTLPGNGHPVNTFTVTATNSTSGETGTSAAQTITVTDPPAISQSNPNFSTTTYPTGNAPEGLAAGDVNGDGFPDLFTADTGSNSISELLNNGNGTFAPVTTAVSVAFPHSVVLADLNADGKLDVITNSGPTGASQVAIALGNGNGTFQAPVSFGSAIGYNEALVADLNGDGKLDVAAIDQYGNTVSVFLGNGDGTFGSQANFAAGTTPTNFAIGDVNGDGKLDLVIGHSNSTLVSVLIGNGDGTFQAPADYSVGPTTSNGHVRLADVNGDGSVDIVDGVDTGTVILLNNGNGTFGSPSPASSGGQPLGLADINGDGKLDLVMTNDTNNTVAVALGNGDGTFQTASNYPTNSAQPGNGTIRDLNGDGKLDIAVPDVSGAAVSVLLNTTDTSPESSEPPTLTAPSSLNVTAGGSTPMGITASPVDSDDKLSVTISGVPLFESIKAPSGDTVTYQLVKGTRGAGDSRTFTITAGTAGQAISGLTLNSTLPGNGHPVNTFTVTASNSTSGETGTSAPKSITVTDPPASTVSGPAINPRSLSDLMSQFGSQDATGARNQLSGGSVGSLTRTNGPMPDIAALTEHFMAAPFVSGGALGLLPSSLTTAEEQRPSLAFHHG